MQEAVRLLVQSDVVKIVHGAGGHAKMLVKSNLTANLHIQNLRRIVQRHSIENAMLSASGAN